MIDFLIIFQDGRYAMLPNGELHIVSVRRGDENHSYHCRILVKPDGRTLTSSRPGRINLLQSSMISSVATRPEKILTVWSGQEAVLNCVHSHRINWYRTAHQFGSLIVPIGLGGRIRMVGGTLILSSVIVEDEGKYFCTFNGSTMATPGAVTELIVRQKLHVRVSAVNAHLQMLIVDAGSKALIICSWSGNPK